MTRFEDDRIVQIRPRLRFFHGVRGEALRYTYSTTLRDRERLVFIQSAVEDLLWWEQQPDARFKPIAMFVEEYDGGFRNRQNVSDMIYPAILSYGFNDCFINPSGQTQNASGISTVLAETLGITNAGVCLHPMARQRTYHGQPYGCVAAGDQDWPLHCQRGH